MQDQVVCKYCSKQVHKQNQILHEVRCQKQRNLQQKQQQQEQQQNQPQLKQSIHSYSQKGQAIKFNPAENSQNSQYSNQSQMIDSQPNQTKQCQYCNQQINRKFIKNHEEICNQRQSCPLCKLVFPQFLIQEHAQQCSETQQQQTSLCEICLQEVVQNELEDHKLAHNLQQNSQGNQQELIQCEKCQQTFQSINEYNDHQLAHSQQENYERRAQEEESKQRRHNQSQQNPFINPFLGSNMMNDPNFPFNFQQGQDPFQAFRQHFMNSGQVVEQGQDPGGNFNQPNQQFQRIIISPGGMFIQGQGMNENQPQLEQLLQQLQGRYYENGMGLQEQQINDLPTSQFQQAPQQGRQQSQQQQQGDKQCMVCLQEFQNGDELRTLKCFHKFHKDCIDNWLNRKPICPICKQRQDA